MIDENKNQVGIVDTYKALNIAREKNLDLVEIAPQANPPVCRIMNYGKYLYELHKRAHETKKHQKQIHIKEIKFRPKISSHDYQFKLKHIIRFIEEGNKVKVTVLFRGRERSRPEFGKMLIDRVLEDTKEISLAEYEPRFEGYQMYILLNPKKQGGSKHAKNKDTQGS